MNTLNFLKNRILKNFLLRAIERKMVRHYGVRYMLCDMYKQPMASQTRAIKEVHEKIIEEDPEAGEIAGKIYQYFRPRVVINMGDNPMMPKWPLRSAGP